MSKYESGGVRWSMRSFFLYSSTSANPPPPTTHTHKHRSYTMIHTNNLTISVVLYHKTIFYFYNIILTLCFCISIF